jgi:hypothetical protein
MREWILSQHIFNTSVFNANDRMTGLVIETMRSVHPIFLIFFSLVIGGNALGGQAAVGAKPPDVLLFTNGEKLMGQLQSATGSDVTFKSEMAGVITVEWSKVQELQTSENFVVVPKGVTLRHPDEASKVAKGSITVKANQVEVNVPQAAPQRMPVADVGNVVSAASFGNAFRRRSFFSDWKGGATLGVALTQATQNNTSISSAFALVRAVPQENWLSLRRRTTVDFNQAYGKLTQPGQPEIKTDLVHAAVEQDWYLKPRLFAFARGVFDHSFSQGLDLQQKYGGGLGFVVLKGVNEELDFKASIEYIDQRFQNATLNQMLVGSTFSEMYTKTFLHGILFTEQAGITPAWNNTNAYTAFASAAVTFPVYHHFGLTVGGVDTFINNPPPTFKKNSFQLTIGGTYNF